MLIREKCRNGPKKFQLPIELKSVKPKVDDDSRDNHNLYQHKLATSLLLWDHRKRLLSFDKTTYFGFIYFCIPWNRWISSEMKTFLLYLHLILLFGVTLTWHFKINFKVVSHYSILKTLRMRIALYSVTQRLTTYTDIPLIETRSKRCKTNSGTYNIILHITLWQKNMQATFGCQCRFMKVNYSKKSTSKSMCLY